MVDKTWRRVAARFENYKKTYQEAAETDNDGEMEAILDCLDAFVRGLTYGLSKRYVKKIWDSVGMTEYFDWELHTEPYLSIAKEAAGDGANGQ